jgi:DNA-binding Lrp family transcriptional regulator
MDTTDVILTKLLLVNSRTSYRDLADKLGLSVNAVHKRIQSLTESGIIRKFTAKASLSALHAVHIFVFGKSETNSLHDLPKKLEKHGSIYWLAIAGGKYLCIGAYLKDLNELEFFVNYVKREAEMSTLTVGIIPTASEFPHAASSSDATLYPLDFQIIRALHNNSRKAMADVAEELGISTKTARRRLSRLINNGLVELGLEWYPDASNDIISIFYIHLKPSTDKSEVDKIFRSHPPNVLFFWSFSNLPGELFTMAWTGTMKELKEIQELFEKQEAFESVVANIVYTGYIFSTWRDELPEI